jgi:two-component system, NarL family, nitrate/nitrite response regulator NarL
MLAWLLLGRAAMSDIRVAIIDDQPLSRAGAVHTLSAEPDIAIVGEGSSVEEALHLAEHAKLGVMLLAVNVPGDFTVMQDVLALCPDLKLVILSGDAEADQVRLAMRMGARGFVVDRITGAELAHSIRLINRGELYLDPVFSARSLALAPAVAPKDDPDRFAGLTSREQQVLAHVSCGSANKEIGSKLNISEKTVKRHVSTILDKLGVSNRIHAALLVASDEQGNR